MNNTMKNIILTVALALVSGCSLIQGAVDKNLASTSGSSGLPGTGSMFVPTANAVITRLNKGLSAMPAGSSSPVPGFQCQQGNNCSKALSNVMGNLPYNSNPLLATGLDQIPLLVYAGCNDLTLSNYGVATSNTTVAAQTQNLINAGVGFVNAHVGGLASSGALNSQVTAVFQTLITSNASAFAAQSPVPSVATQIKQDFYSICMAANSFGIAMTGF